MLSIRSILILMLVLLISMVGGSQEVLVLIVFSVQLVFIIVCVGQIHFFEQDYIQLLTNSVLNLRVFYKVKQLSKFSNIQYNHKTIKPFRNQIANTTTKMKSLRMSQKIQRMPENNHSSHMKFLIQAVQFILSKLLQIQKSIGTPLTSQPNISSTSNLNEALKKKTHSMIRINQKKVTKVNTRQSEKVQTPTGSPKKQFLNTNISPRSPVASIQGQIQQMIKKVSDFENENIRMEQNGSFDNSLSIFQINRLKQNEQHLNNLESMLNQELNKIRAQNQAMQEDICQLLIMFKDMTMNR